MSGFDDIALWLYSDGDLLMFACRVFTLVFVLEVFAYIVSLVMGISRVALK